MTESEIYPVSLLVHWAVGEDQLWCLVTNLQDQALTLKTYGRRMWIEEMFGDLKPRGFDLESALLRHAERLSCLTLAVVPLYLWSVSTGSRTIHEGRRHWIDRKDWRDLSIFQIGLRFIDRQLINALPIHLSLCTYL